MESEEEDEEDRQEGGASSEELTTVVRELGAKLEDMQTCSELIAKHGATLQRLLGELEQPDDAQGKSKAVGERATLFRIASNAMINVKAVNKSFNTLLIILLSRLVRLIYPWHKHKVTNG